MSKSIPSLTTIDLEDYAAIKKHLPLATPNQVKWIKQMFDMARSAYDQSEPVPMIYLGICDSLDNHSDNTPREIVHLIKMQMLANIKRCIGRELKKQREKYKPKSQINLFHPEAFEDL